MRSGAKVLSRLSVEDAGLRPRRAILRLTAAHLSLAALPLALAGSTLRDRRARAPTSPLTVPSPTDRTGDARFPQSGHPVESRVAAARCAEMQHRDYFNAEL